MKKLTFMCLAALALLATSCANKTASADSDQDSAIAFEQSQVEQKVKLELDSLAAEWSKLSSVQSVLTNGKITLSDDELKLKPTYLLDLKAADDLAELSQKYRALGIYAVDKQVAELYKQDLEGYNALMAKIAADINDPAVKGIQAPNPDDIKTFYAEEEKAGRINLFWEASAAATVEAMYVIVQNTDKFLPAFDDKAASEITLRLQLIKLSLDDLAQYDTNIAALGKILEPLNTINAINAAQLKEQLAAAKPKVEAARAALLK